MSDLTEKESTQTVASLKATPNPVPYGLGLGSTTVTWDVGDDSVGQVYVSTNGGPEKLFASGSHGSQDALWNSEYEVLLCNSYLAHQYKKALKTMFPNAPPGGGSGGFLMRRKLP